jgi:hypothetical protein
VFHNSQPIATHCPIIPTITRPTNPIAPKLTPPLAAREAFVVTAGAVAELVDELVPEPPIVLILVALGPKQLPVRVGSSVGPLPNQVVFVTLILIPLVSFHRQSPLVPPIMVHPQSTVSFASGAIVLLKHVANASASEGERRGQYV